MEFSLYKGKFYINFVSINYLKKKTCKELFLHSALIVHLSISLDLMQIRLSLSPFHPSYYCYGHHDLQDTKPHGHLKSQVAARKAEKCSQRSMVG